MKTLWICQSADQHSSTFMAETAHQAAERYLLHFAALALDPHRNHQDIHVSGRVQVFRPGETCYSLHDVDLRVTIGHRPRPPFRKDPA